MENKNPIHEELKQISPAMADLFTQKQASPEPDSIYFNELPGKMLIKVKEAQVVPLKKRVPILRYIMGSGVAAALIGIIVMTNQRMDTNTQSPNLNIHQELSKISNEDLEAFLIYPTEQMAVNTELKVQLEQIDSNEIISFTNYNDHEN